MIDTYVPDDGISVTSYTYDKNGNPVEEPRQLYDKSFLAVKDKYAMFLGGQQSLGVIRTGPGGPQAAADPGFLHRLSGPLPHRPLFRDPPHRPALLQALRRRLYQAKRNRRCGGALQRAQLCHRFQPSLAGPVTEA